PKYKPYLILLSFLMSIYVIASMSMLAIFMFYAGMLSFIYFQHQHEKNKRLLMMFCISLLVSVIYLFGFIKADIADKMPALQTQNTPNSAVQSPNVKQGTANWDDLALPANLMQRLSYWQFYYNGITENSQSLLFGHAKRPDRETHPSAHNYYLDFVYNFGVVSIIPLLGLIVYTLWLFARFAKNVSHVDKREFVLIFNLSGIVFFLLVADNFLKVSLRQPYSGVITFFLWGLLINKLSQIYTKVRNVG
ncbi:MAG: hypothetical protein ACT4OH_07130, partial [Methylophilaceae bacterium]